MSDFWAWWTSPTTRRRYWDKDIVSWVYGQCKNAGMSDNAVAGLLGNIYWESGICPYKCEGIAIVSPSLNYTIANIRNATRQQFIDQRYPSGTGYSLAQWSYSRKGDYYDYGQWNLIGTEYQVQRDTGFLLQDLQQNTTRTSINESIWSAQNKTTWQWLTDPNVSLYDALNAVLMLFERPWGSAPSQSQWQTEYDNRNGPAGDILQDFAGITPPPTPPIPPTPPTPTPGHGLPFWLYFKMKEMNSNGI